MPRSSLRSADAKPSMSAGEAHTRAAAMKKRQELRTAQLRHDMEGHLNDLHTHQVWARRWSPWVARLALLPLIAFTVSGAYVVARALLSGEVKDFTKYSKRIYLLTEEPAWFWYSTLAYAALTCLFGWLLFATARVAFRRRSAA